MAIGGQQKGYLWRIGNYGKPNGSVYNGELLTISASLWYLLGKANQILSCSLRCIPEPEKGGPIAVCLTVWRERGDIPQNRSYLRCRSITGYRNGIQPRPADRRIKEKTIEVKMARFAAFSQSNIFEYRQH